MLVSRDTTVLQAAPAGELGRLADFLECTCMRSGEALEIQVKRMLEFDLQEGKLGLTPGTAQIFHHKAYFSKDRSSDIVFDIVIEVRRPNASEPWLVWIWECKDETRAVAVDEVEEFASKLQQIGVHGVKGTMASRNGFQQSAVQYAKSKRIGLLRQLADGTTIRLLEAVRTVSDASVLFGLTHPDTRNLCSMTYGLSSSGLGVDQFRDFVQIELNEAAQDG
jgi:hypothetical protein